MTATVADQITAEIGWVGDQTRALAQRYEGVFGALREALRSELAACDSLADGALAAMGLADAAADAFQTSLPNQPARDCRAGCDACCHLPVMVPPGVAEAIAGYLVRVLAPDALESLKVELERAAGDGEGAAPVPPRRRCVFLTDEGRCSIYAVRPPTCRAFTSASAAACRTMVHEPAGGVAAIPQNPSHYRLYVEVTAALEQAARARGLSDRQTDLAAGVLAALGAG